MIADVVTLKKIIGCIVERIVRSGLGSLLKYYEVLLNRKVNQDVKKETTVTWNLLL